MITTKKHNKIVDIYTKEILDLKIQLKESKDLKDILTKMSSMTINGIDITASVGGKVIKQEGNKCIVIDKEGNVKTGLTKQKLDKGYSYKLIRN